MEARDQREARGNFCVQERVEVLWVLSGGRSKENDRFLSDEKLPKINVECRGRKKR
jgi:hypothetical protein